MIGIDTSAIIDLYKNDDGIVNLLISIDDEIVSTGMNYYEILTGLDLTIKKHKEEEEYYEKFFNSLNALNLNKSACKKASEILWNLRKKGFAIGDFDSIVAGILLTNGVDKIITKNVRHFEKIPGLNVLSY
jgi:predicted nucleic acid-binding protein